LSFVKDDALRTFLGELIDDAGLFPPACLDVPAALAAHERASAGDAFWVVGRFVVPGSRLMELAAELDQTPDPLAVSALVEPRDGDAGEALAALARRSEELFPRLALEALECPLAGLAGDSDDERLAKLLAAADAAAFARSPALYVEIAMTDSGQAPDGLLALHRARERAPERELFAKIRCAGQGSAAVPAAAAVAGFLWEANRLGVPFKATAGLHHPVRGEPSPAGEMHGFLNVIGGAVLAHARGVDRRTLEALVAERDPARFELDGRRFAWRGIGADAGEIGAARAGLIHSYGSCSLDEPVADLRALGMLPAAFVA
jgi:hypothetical protein